MTKKSAFVIAGGDGDAFVKESLGKKETRVEFDFGLTATKTTSATIRRMTQPGHRHSCLTSSTPSPRRWPH